MKNFEKFRELILQNQAKPTADNNPFSDFASLQKQQTLQLLEAYHNWISQPN